MVSRERKLRSLPEGGIHRVRLERAEKGYRIRLDESGAETIVERSGQAETGVWSILTPGGASFEATVERGESEIVVRVGHSPFRFALETGSRGAQRASASGRIEVRSPMPGKVVRVLATAGQSVAAGEPILLFEAMKMQNELRSPQEGVVAQVSVEAGQSVEARELLYILDPIPNPLKI